MGVAHYSSSMLNEIHFVGGSARGNSRMFATSSLGRIAAELRALRHWTKPSEPTG
jgi:hypothetical protein